MSSLVNSISEGTNKSPRSCETLPMSSSNDDSEEAMYVNDGEEKSKKNVKEKAPKKSTGNANEKKPAPQAKPNGQKSEDVKGMITTSEDGFVEETKTEVKDNRKESDPAKKLSTITNTSECNSNFVEKKTMSQEILNHQPQQTTEQVFYEIKIEPVATQQVNDSSETLDSNKLEEKAKSREKDFAKEIRRLSRKNAQDSIARAELEMKLVSMEKQFEEAKKELNSSRTELSELKKHLLADERKDLADPDHPSSNKSSIQGLNQKKITLVIDNQESKSFPSSQFFATHARSRNRSAHTSNHRGRSSSPTITERMEYDLSKKSEKLKKLLDNSSNVNEEHKTNFKKEAKKEKSIEATSPKGVKEKPNCSTPMSEISPKDIHQKIEKSFDVEKTLNSCNLEVITKEYRSLVRTNVLQKEHNAKLLAKILSLQGNIQVCCRVRPLLNTESKIGQKVITETISEEEVSCIDRKRQLWKSYGFDKVWGPDTKQEDVFCDIQPLALSVVDGYNACIFAYGQTGSGKTYTMEGSMETGELGISHRTIKKIFALLSFRAKQHAATVALQSREGDDDDSASKFVFTLKVGMMEIYNDEVYDLLLPPIRRGSYIKKPTLDIRRSKKGTIEVPGLEKELITSLDDVIRIFKIANKNRATSSTNLNEHSSRSHMILNVEVVSGVEGNDQNIGKLFLVDLAGSERVRKSAVVGQQLKEASYINKSLAALGNVMQALDKKASHIPFRDSKLTYLLQDCFCGNSKTMMIVNVCPGSFSYDETQCTLKFATRVRKVHIGTSRRNIVSGINLGKTVRKLTSELLLMTEAKHQTELDLRYLKREYHKLKERLERYMNEGKNPKQNSIVALELDNQTALLVIKGIENCKKELSRMQTLMQGDEEENNESSNKDNLQVYTNKNTMEKEIHEFQKHVASFSPQPKIIRDPGEIRQTVIEILKNNEPEHVDKINDIMARFKGKESILLEKTISRYRAQKLEEQTPAIEFVQEEVLNPPLKNKGQEEFNTPFKSKGQEEFNTPSKTIEQENDLKLAHIAAVKRAELAEKKHRNRLEVARAKKKNVQNVQNVQ